LSGPSFPGDLVTDVARTGSNGQLEALLSGAALDWSDTQVKGLPLPTQNIVDDYIQQRANSFAQTAATSPGAKLLASDMQSAVAAARDLKNLRYVMDFTGGTTLDDKTQVAVDALSIGLSRCVTLSDEMSWDTHADKTVTRNGIAPPTIISTVDPPSRRCLPGLLRGLSANRKLTSVDARPANFPLA